ncbi:O-antigen polymerase [Onishia niordana]|uniref:O-antigen polymerase n=1 Tax=Onishia niordana TaxID=2508711 RepID=UPI00109F141B|nr:O-antigen polymerase [Halomonas niordiana]
MKNTSLRLSKPQEKLLFFVAGLWVVVQAVVISDLTVSLLSLAFIVISGVLLFNSRSLLDPRVLFTSFFALYSTWYPLRVIFSPSLILPVDHGDLAVSVNHSLVGVFSYLVVCNLLISKGDEFFSCASYESRRKSFLSENIIALIFGSIVLIMITLLYSSGASSKQELVSEAKGINSYTVFAFLIVINYFIFRVVRSENFFRGDLPVFLIFLVSFFYMILAGERDIVFRVILIVLVIQTDKRRNASFWFVFLLCVAAAFIAPLSQVFKAVLISGGFDIAVIYNGLGFLFNNEFISASRNVYSVIYFGVEHSFGYLYTDVLRAFIPSIFFDSSLMSTGKWFDDVYRPENGFSGTSGWGFGYVAQGYLLGSYFGVIVVLSIVATVNSWLFILRGKSIYWFVFYVLALLTSIYCIRADVANLFSQTFKVGGLSVIMFYLFHVLLNKRNCS